VAANLALFLPLGLALRACGLGPWRAAAAAGACSVAVELLQAAGIPGRDPTLSDVVANTGGALLGAWAAGRARGWAAPAPGAARRLAAGAGGAWLVAAALAAALLGRETAADAPPPRASAGLAAPPFGWYGGEVVEATVDGWRSGRRPAGTGPASVLATLGPRTTATARLRGGDHGGRTVPFLYVHDGAGRLQLSLAQSGPDLVIYARRRADRWRLREPAVRLAGALAAVQGRAADAEAVVRVELAGDTVRASVAGGGRLAADTSVVAPTTAWSLVVPSARVGGPERPALTAAYLAALLAPLGYWLWWGTRDLSRAGRAAAGAAAATAVAGGLGAAPRLAAMTPATAGEWAFAGAAVAAGWLAAAWGAPRRGPGFGGRLAPRPGARAAFGPCPHSSSPSTPRSRCSAS
jgi:hypothetical protein